MELTIEANQINDWLASNGPKNPKGEPMFRLVWSDDQTEIRRGEVRRECSIHLPNGQRHTFVAVDNVTERLPKYSYIRARWILEQWAGPEVAFNPELPESQNGSFEPLYVFEDSKGNPLQLNLRVIQLIVKRALSPSPSEMARRSQALEEEQRRDEEEQKFLEEALDLSPMASLFHFGEAAVVPANFDITSPNLRSKE